jgi:hypothetical protein
VAQARQKLQGVVMARRGGGPVLPTVDLVYPFEGRWLTQNSPGVRASGNSTEPHVHLQAMDHPDPSRASAVAITFDGHLPRNGDVVDARRS